MPSKPTTTAPEEEAKPALVPKIRFPEFRETEGWPADKLAELCDLNKGEQLAASDKDAGGRYPHYNGGISPSSYTGRANREANTIIISEGGNSCGYVQFVTEPFWSGGHNYSLAVKPKVNTLCLFYALQAKQREIMALRIGSGLPNIQKTTLGQFDVFLPPRSAEQQKIAECLSSVDELIAAQAREVDALKTHKKGLMQQLFPREGETQPRLRFPEFQNAREWSARKLGDFADVSASGDLETATFSPEHSETHCFPIYSNAVENEGIYGYSSVAKHQANSVTITARGTLGKAFLRTTGFVGIGRLIVVTNFIGVVDARFLRECWDHLAVIPQEVTSIPQLTAVAARATVLPFPSLPEQQRIASCLSSLDALITAETQKHEALKTHKRGLMQQLFPSPEEVTP